MKKLGMGLAACAAAVTLGSSIAAADYPPPPPPTTPVTTPTGGTPLPATGNEAFPMVQVGSGVIAAGIGLLVVGGVRRRRLA